MYTEIKIVGKTFCQSLRDHSMKIINLKKKKMKLLTKEQEESYEDPEIWHICKENLENKYMKDKEYCKARDHCHYTGGAAHSICNLKHSLPKNIPIAFHNRSNYE